MIAGPLFVTPHALQRFVETTRGVPEDRARALLADEPTRARMLGELVRETEGAHRVRDQRDGCALWRGPKPRRLRLIVGPGEGDRPALVTVLPAHDGLRPKRESACR